MLSEESESTASKLELDAWNCAYAHRYGLAISFADKKSSGVVLVDSVVRLLSAESVREFDLQLLNASEEKRPAGGAVAFACPLYWFGCIPC